MFSHIFDPFHEIGPSLSSFFTLTTACPQKLYNKSRIHFFDSNDNTVEYQQAPITNSHILLKAELEKLTKKRNLERRKNLIVTNALSSQSRPMSTVFCHILAIELKVEVVVSGYVYTFSKTSCFFN